jgi:cytochrome b
MTEEAMKQTSAVVAVWDWPTRVFHWLLVASFALAWLTYEDNRYLDVHVFAGYVMLALLLFRLGWGVWGGRYACFRQFGYGWTSVRAYLRGLLSGHPRRYLGHNPAGAWAVFVLLALGFVVTLTGLLVIGGEERHGPFAGMLGFQQGTAIRAIHELAAWLMLALVLVHIAGVAVDSLLHRENLVKAMITGYKRADTGAEETALHRVVGTVMLGTVLAAATVYFVGYLLETPERPYRPFIGRVLPDNATWRTECGSCHLAYHPTLLPARSWEKLLAQQADHFGENLALDAQVLTEIKGFLLRNAAESRLSEPAWKISASIPAADTPLRITEMPYWKMKHNDIPEKVWRRPKVGGRANCGACHLDAEQGTFEDAAMRLPSAATTGQPGAARQEVR